MKSLRRPPPMARERGADSLQLSASRTLSAVSACAVGAWMYLAKLGQGVGCNRAVTLGAANEAQTAIWPFARHLPKSAAHYGASDRFKDQSSSLVLQCRRLLLASRQFPDRVVS